MVDHSVEVQFGPSKEPQLHLWNILSLLRGLTPSVGGGLCCPVAVAVFYPGIQRKRKEHKSRRYLAKRLTNIEIDTRSIWARQASYAIVGFDHFSLGDRQWKVFSHKVTLETYNQQITIF